MSGMFSSKHSRYRKYVDRKTGKVFYFDVVLKRSRWRIPRNEIPIKTKDEDEDEVVKIFREDVEEGEWYRVEHHLLTRPYWFRNDDSETKERQWEKPLQKAASKEKAVETTEEEFEEEEEEETDIEFDPDAYENEEGKEQFHQRSAFVAGTEEAEAEPAFDPPPPRRATTAAASAVIIEEKEEEEPKTNNASPKLLTASDEIAMNENFNAANKSKALDVFFALCEKAKINEHSRWERDMPKLRKLDKNAFECFATMPERRSAFNKYKVKLSSNAAQKAVGTTTTTKESKLEREKIAREKREREILEKKRDDEYRLKKLKRNQDKGDAMKQFETLLAESIKSIDDVETIDDVRELLSQDPLGRASSGGPLSEADMVASFDAFLLEFKSNSLQRYTELCRETVSALSQSVGGVADEEDAIFAWEIARDVLKEDARFDRCPMKLRRSTFDKAVENFRDERIRNAGTTGASFDAV
ncbi:unnamed protein product [Bathycoccus prasinos]|jgi:hypothetical protein